MSVEKQRIGELHEGAFFSCKRNSRKETLQYVNTKNGESKVIQCDGRIIYVDPSIEVKLELNWNV